MFNVFSSQIWYECGYLGNSNFPNHNKSSLPPCRCMSNIYPVGFLTSLVNAVQLSVGVPGFWVWWPLVVKNEELTLTSNELHKVTWKFLLLLQTTMAPPRSNVALTTGISFFVFSSGLLTATPFRLMFLTNFLNKQGLLSFKQKQTGVITSCPCFEHSYTLVPLEMI